MKTKVYFNNSCSICRTEINEYKKHSTDKIEWVDISTYKDSESETDKKTDYPGKQIATKIQYAWNQDHNEPITVVFGDEWLAGNLSYHLKSRPIWEGPVSKDKLNSLSKFTCIDNICVGYR